MAPILITGRVFADRADDFLSLSLNFSNLQISTLSPGEPALTIADPTRTAYIVVTFPSQHILEETFVEETAFLPANQPELTSQSPTEPDSRLSGSSQVAFVVPANAGPIPFDLQTLLQKCLAFPLSVPSAAAIAFQPHGGPVVLPGSGGSVLQNLILQHRAALQTRRSVTLTLARGAAAAGRLAGSAGQPPAAPENAVGDNVTAIEIPVGLFVSPHQFGAWSHATAPRSSAETGRTELWHTRLVGPSPTITATGSDSRDPVNNPPLTGAERRDLAHQSSGHSDITVNNLMLTSLGGWLDVRGSWSGQNITITNWRHIATLGRDHYVRVVEAGYLFPFGHRASVTEISERLFHPSMPGNPAYLRSTYTLTVLEHDKYYAATAVADPSSGKRYDLQMPFRRVRITETVVPNLARPKNLDGSESFPVRLLSSGGGNLFFHVIAEDLDGNDIDFLAPLYFVAKGDDQNQTVNSIKNAYDTDQSSLGRCDLHGQRVPFADHNDPNTTDIKPGSTSFETASITFSAVLADPGQFAPLQWECHFYPIVAGGTIVVPALKRLSGNSQPISVKYNDNYLINGFAPGVNAGQVFLELENPSDPAARIVFKDHADRSGGLANPDTQVKSLSRSLGPVAGTPFNISQGTFNPNDVFNEFLDNVWLFGTIPLNQVLAPLSPPGFNIAKDLAKVPRFISDAVTMFESLAQDIMAAEQLAQTVASAIAANASSLASTPARVPTASSLGSLVATLTNDLNKVNTDIKNLIADVGAVGPSLENFIQNPSDQNRGDLNNKVSTFVKDLNSFANDCQTLLSDLPALPDFSSAKHQLQQILGRVQSVVPQVGQDVQNFVKNFVNMLSAEQLTIKLTWHPQLQKIGVDLKTTSDTSKALFIPSSDPNDFEISIEAEVSKTGAAPSADIYCSLRNFKLQLIYVPGVDLGPFVTINFAALEFTVAAGKSPDVNVQLDPKTPIAFHDPLSFINTIEQLIPAHGFSDPPALTVNAQGIQANYSIGLPNVGIGVFSLSNLSLGAGFSLPFIVKPLEVDFNFCSREQPFMLSVAFLAGGGFFLMTATPKGVSVEASLDFGANVSVDLGVASGGAHIVAGIIFAMESDGTVSLTGFLKMGGHLSVLDLISLSIELDLDLEYYFSPTNSLIGEATITVEVSVLTFSEGVQISCRKQFEGSPSRGESPRCSRGRPPSRRFSKT